MVAQKPELGTRYKFVKWNRCCKANKALNYKDL